MTQPTLMPDDLPFREVAIHARNMEASALREHIEARQAVKEDHHLLALLKYEAAVTRLFESGRLHRALERAAATIAALHAQRSVREVADLGDADATDEHDDDVEYCDGRH
jgi:hypothetical protein